MEGQALVANADFNNRNLYSKKLKQWVVTFPPTENEYDYSKITFVYIRPSGVLI